MGSEITLQSTILFTFSISLVFHSIIMVVENISAIHVHQYHRNVDVHVTYLVCIGAYRVHGLETITSISIDLSRKKYAHIIMCITYTITCMCTVTEMQLCKHLNN